MAPGNPKRKKKRRDKYAVLHDIDIRDSAAIEQLGVRGMRHLAKLNNIQIPRSCRKRDEILLAIQEYVQQLYGKDHVAAEAERPTVPKERVEQIRERTEKNVANNHINWDEVKRMCQYSAAPIEIRGFLGVSMEVLSAKCIAEYGIEWEEFYALHTANGKLALRQMQMKLALDKEKPNVSMLIYLGKVVLGQVESKPGGNGQVPDGVLTTDSLISYLAANNLMAKDVLKDSVAQVSAFETAMADDQDDALRQRMKGLSPHGAVFADTSNPLA